jgi:hypothetical protein
VSKLFEGVLADGTKRFAASIGMGNAEMFVAMARLLEHEVGLPSGIADDPGTDEHLIDAADFRTFFETIWQSKRWDWLVERRGGLFHVWAQYAAGMIENIDLQPKTWVDRNGETLHQHRYLRPDE